MSIFIHSLALFSLIYYSPPPPFLSLSLSHFSPNRTSTMTHILIWTMHGIDLVFGVTSIVCFFPHTDVLKYPIPHCRFSNTMIYHSYKQTNLWNWLTSPLFDLHLTLMDLDLEFNCLLGFGIGMSNHIHQLSSCIKRCWIWTNGQLDLKIGLVPVVQLPIDVYFTPWHIGIGLRFGFVLDTRNNRIHFLSSTRSHGQL